MPYSVMVWLVDAGEQKNETEMRRQTKERRVDAGTTSGVNVPPAFTRMTYGFYESRAEADRALGEISENLRKNVPLHIERENGKRTFLVPAHRVHYIVCDEVTRPKDRDLSDI